MTRWVEGSCRWRPNSRRVPLAAATPPCACCESRARQAGHALADECADEVDAKHIRESVAKHELALGRFGSPLSVCPVA